MSDRKSVYDIEQVVKLEREFRAFTKIFADVVKVNFPDPTQREGVKSDYDAEFTTQEAVNAVVRSASRALVLLSGGEKAGDEAMLDKSRQSLDAGATGLIFGRNVWQRPHDESLRFVDELKALLAKYPRPATGRL